MRGVIVGFGLLAIAQAVLSRPDSSGRLAEGGSWLANAFRRLGSPAVAGVPQVRGVLTNVGTSLGTVAAGAAGQLGQIIAQGEPRQRDTRRG